MMMKIYSAVTNPTDSLSKINSKISDTYPNFHKNLVENYTNLSDTFNSNYSAISNKFNETCPNFSSGLTNTRSTITSTINNGTGYIFSLPTSIGDTVTSYASVASMFEPVDPEDKEVARIPPNESLAENVIPLQADREKIIHSVLDLYSCKPTKESFDVYNDDVIFDEPFIYSTGLSDIKSHFYGMQKFFVKSTTSEYKILENTPNVLKVGLKQKYVLPYVSRAAVYNSEITLELSENKITKHIDRWNGEEGVFRRVVVVRKGVGKLFTFLVSVPEN